MTVGVRKTELDRIVFTKKKQAVLLLRCHVYRRILAATFLKDPPVLYSIHIEIFTKIYVSSILLENILLIYIYDIILSFFMYVISY